MLLTIDIGNSSIKFGVFDGDHLHSKFSIPTKPDSTVNDISQAVGTRLDSQISAVIISSVVPELESPLVNFLKGRTGCDAVIVGSSFDFGLKIKYQPLSSAGTDRLIAAFAAVEKYGAPVIVCDFGTATTIDAVNSSREYLGGIIAPGMNTLAEVLHLKTSKLPRVPIERPASVIGNTTSLSIQSGIFFGHVGLVEGILTRMATELGNKPKVVATGGFAAMIAEECGIIDVVDENLMIYGLHLLFSKNQFRAPA